MHFQPAQDGSPQESEQPWQLTLYIMFFAQLLSIIGFAFTLPFLPVYIRELGVTDERLVPVWAGSLGMAADPLFGGIIVSWWGYRWPFALVSAMTVLALLPIALGVRQRPR